MTQPENFTVAQASDPQTPGQVLADIAALRPDLRVAVAGNPSTYPGLLEWLRSLGDPAVDAAIAARPPAGQATQQLPVQPPTAPQGVAPQWAGQAPSSVPPQGYPGTPPQGYPGTPPQGYPGTPPQGYPGMAPQGYVGMPPQGAPSSLQYGGTPPTSSNKALWIILGIVGGLIVLGIVGVIVFLSFIRDRADDVIDEIDEITGDAFTYGDDAALDALWDACEAEDWDACDSLYMRSPVGSEYEDFGDTCGNRTDGSSFCTSEFGAAGDLTDTPSAYGDDTALDALWDACEAEDWDACNSLYMQSPVGSEYESFGDTCGYRTDGTVDCGPFTYGDDTALDALWDACTGEDWQACDDLYLQSAVGSEYEAYGDTCGNKYAAGTPDYCVDVMP